MSTNSLEEYFEALARLVANKPERIAPGTRITNDAVAQEAGRGKGSIKKSRPVFADLIAAIDAAATAQATAANPDKDKLAAAKAAAEDYRQKWEAALARELSLVQELFELKQQLAKLTGGNVLPLRRPALPQA